VRDIVGDRLDILVANAGISRAKTIEETSIEDFDALFAVNVRAPYFLVQQLLPILSDGSSFIFTSSLAACSCRQPLSLCRDQGRDRHAGEALRLHPRAERHPCERCCTGRCRTGAPPRRVRRLEPGLHGSGEVFVSPGANGAGDRLLDLDGGHREDPHAIRARRGL
jgi:hypothetical protein